MKNSKVIHFSKDNIRVKQKIYIHEEIKIGWFRLSYFRLGRKFSIRFEISRGWEEGGSK